ncbi:MAG: GntR family transcriptional regulator [Lentisphaeria bacterium]
MKGGRKSSESGCLPPDKHNLGQQTEMVKSRLVSYILDHNLSVGERLPTQDKLRKNLGVGSRTIQRAVESLALAGVVETRSCGVFLKRSDADGFFGHQLGLISSNFQERPDALYLQQYLTSVLRHRNCNVLNFYRNASPPQMADGFDAYPGLQRNISQRLIELLVSLVPLSSEIVTCCQQSGIPVFYCGLSLGEYSASISSCVGEALSYFQEAGFHRPAVIFSGAFPADCVRALESFHGENYGAYLHGGLAAPELLKSYLNACAAGAQPDSLFISDEFLACYLYSTMPEAGCNFPPAITVKHRQLPICIPFELYGWYEIDADAIAVTIAENILCLLRKEKPACAHNVISPPFYHASQQITAQSSGKVASVVRPAASFSPYAIGNRRELFIDDFVTDQRNNLTLQLHEPKAQLPVASQPTGYYMTMLQQDGIIHCYSRRNFLDYTGSDSPYLVKPGFTNEYTAYFQSKGGITFLEPPLFLYDCGIPNVALCMQIGIHNFSPFYDSNPKCPDDERFKAIAGVSDIGGLYCFCSPDCYHFQRREKVMIEPRKEWGYCFDSQNVIFWSEVEGCYVCYFRVNITPDGRKLRSFCKGTSPDLVNWEFTQLEVNLENEHLYVSLIAPYPRAPHIYIGTPTRYCEERGSATDIALIFSREGRKIARPSNEAWIRPGLNTERWKNRSNYLAYNVVQTSPSELSYYHILSKVRYTLRTDGYCSLHAGYAEGEWLSKPLQYKNGKLEFNLATSVMGSFKVELQNSDGVPIKGCTMDESEIFYGDSIAYTPSWNGYSKLPFKKGDIFRIRCLARECDVFSFVIS